uniref:OTU domain-containing protein n=1 Tax=Amphimedon queenslandica TaxID=400682 RepID=A0A1X7U878_AMPQE
MSGLSIDMAIIDLSTEVFGDGMAYVTLSRVRTLNGLHLLSFDPLSVKTCNPKKDDVIFTYEEPPNPDMMRRRQRNYVYYPATTILPGSPTTPLSDKRIPNSTLDVPGDGNCIFYALSYLISHY